MSLKERLGTIVGTGRAKLERLRFFRRVARKTGLVESLRLGGIRCLMTTGGRTNSSTIFRFHARNSPNRTGLVYRDRSYSFFEMNEQMDRVGAGLAAAGIGPGDSVVLMLKNAPEFLFVQAGVGRLGGAADDHGGSDADPPDHPAFVRAADRRRRRRLWRRAPRQPGDLGV